jgi:transaldolase
MLESGKFAQMMKEDAVVGVTTNPTIFQKAIAEGDAYDEQLKELLETESDPKEVFLQLSARDVDAATDLLADVHERQPEDGFVSWEVDPTLAYDRDATFDEAMRLHAWLDKPNLYVKIPATKPGLGAIEDSIALGKSINVTLIFSLLRYAEVVEAYLRGLERLVASGGDPSKVHSVASFFVSRVDTETDKRLDAIGSKEALALRGKLAIANAKLAYEHYEHTFAAPRWEFLAGKGANVQRCLWASSSARTP